MKYSELGHRDETIPNRFWRIVVVACSQDFEAQRGERAYDDLVSEVVSPKEAPAAKARWKELPQRVFRILVKF